MKCPRCGYERKITEGCPEWQCPSCQTAYNKHPAYNGNNYYSIQLAYKKPPTNIEVKPGKLYLYLINDMLEGAVLDKAGLVERIYLSNDDLGQYANGIQNILNSPPSVLTNEQEVAIFTATSIKKNQQSDKDEDTKKNGNRTLFLVCCLIFLSLIFFYFFSNDNSENKNTATDKKNNSFISSQQVITQNKSNTNESDLINTRELDLEFIASKLYLANVFAKRCKNICQSDNIKDESCDKSNEILETISTKIRAYKKYVQGNNVDGLSSKNNKLVEQINQYLWNIPTEIESAATFCNKQQKNAVDNSDSSDSMRDSKKINMLDFDVNVREVQSKIEITVGFLEKCADSCVRYKKGNVNCLAHKEFYNKFSNEYEQYLDLVNKYGRYSFSNEDQEIIEYINKKIQEHNQYIELIKENCGQ